jgi:hypothetical protein
MTRRKLSKLWWGAGLLALALAACSQQPGQTTAALSRTEEKTLAVKPENVPVKVSFLVGQLQGAKVTERVEGKTGKVVESSPELRGMLKLKNTSEDQAVRLLSGRIQYVDADGKMIPLAKEQGDTSFTFYSYQAERLDPGMQTSEYVDVPFPAAAVEGKKLQDIRLELTYLPIPYKEETVDIPVSLGS